MYFECFSDVNDSMNRKYLGIDLALSSQGYQEQSALITPQLNSSMELFKAPRESTFSGVQCQFDEDPLDSQTIWNTPYVIS